MTPGPCISDRPWFSIRYNSFAPAGLPPVIRAGRIMHHADDTGTWIVALWNPDGRGVEDISASILRVPTDQVATVTRHRDLAEAARQAFSATPQDPAANGHQTEGA